MGEAISEEEGALDMEPTLAIKQMEYKPVGSRKEDRVVEARDM